MSGYLLSVIGAVILSAIMVAILPEGKTSGIIKAVSRLVCILAIISPVLKFFQSGTLTFAEGENSEGIFTQTVIESENAFIEYYSERRIRETESALETEIHEKYGADVEVTLSYEYVEKLVDGRYVDKKIRITAIHIGLKDTISEEALREMWEYLTKNYCSEVLIE